MQPVPALQVVASLRVERPDAPASQAERLALPRAGTAAVQAQQVDDPARQREKSPDAPVSQGADLARQREEPSAVQVQEADDPAPQPAEAPDDPASQADALARRPGRYRGAPAQRAGVLARAVKWSVHPAQAVPALSSLSEEAPAQEVSQEQRPAAFVVQTRVSHQARPPGREERTIAPRPRDPLWPDSSFRGAPWAT